MNIQCLSGTPPTEPPDPRFRLISFPTTLQFSLHEMMRSEGGRRRPYAPCRLRQSLRRRRPSRTRLPARCVECRRLRVTVPLRRSLPRGGVHAARGRGRCLPFPGFPAQCHARRQEWRRLDGPGRRVRRGRLTPVARSGTSRDGRGRRPPRDRARRARGRARPGPGTAWPGCPRGRSRSACRTRSQGAAPAVPP